MEYEEDRRHSLAVRIERVISHVERHAGGNCAKCHELLCGHSAVFSLVSGYEEAPICLSCLSLLTERSSDVLRDEMLMFIGTKPCLTQGWRLANLREGFEANSVPKCHWGAAVGPSSSESEPATDTESSLTSAPSAQDEFDAGDTGCGELVLQLRIRINRLKPGHILHLRATDPGAPEDIPAWCRLTGNALAFQNHPNYFIQRKDS